MKNHLFVTIVFLITPFLANSQAVIDISNPTKLTRTEEVISIPWRDIQSVYPGIDTAYFAVADPVTKKQVPFQLEYNGGKEVRNLLVQVSVKAKAKRVLQIIRTRPQKFLPKTYCRYVPERKDDFAWENDKIAFRAYGKALENTSEDAYGFDVWVKRTRELVINKRYQKGDYHNDHGDGMDYYHVGFSLGAGNIAPYINDSIWYSGNYRNWKILENGPLRSSFQLVYNPWNAGEQKVTAVKTLTIDAGTQLHKVEVSYVFEGSGVLPVVVGIIKREQPGIELFDEQNGIMAYWEPTDPRNGTTGVGCVFTQPIKNVFMQKGQMFSLLEARSGQPVTYYRGAAWDKAGDITSAKDWFSYIRDYRQKINQPMKVAVHK